MAWRCQPRLAGSLAACLPEACLKACLNACQTCRKLESACLISSTVTLRIRRA